MGVFPKRSASFLLIMRADIFDHGIGGEMTYSEYKERYSLPLDPAQDKACIETEGHILLLAVPGSGKTTVMIARLGYLTKGLSVPADSILAVTYSVAGAKEMQTRYEKLFGSRDIEIRTINGFCAKVINRYEKCRGTRAFRLIDNDGEVSGIIRKIMTSCGGYPSENEVKDIKTAITYCRNSMLSDGEISKMIPAEGRDFAEIYKNYRDFKRANRLMDYDDQLCYAYRILCTCPDVYGYYADRFRYICVDEAQDTSKIQHMIIRKLTERGGNLFMVGDEDQSIYGFRAAYPDGLMEFDTVYPDAKILYIEKNYRSSRTIVEAAGRFISVNTSRREKHMVTDRGNGAPVKYTELGDLRELPAYILHKASEAAADSEHTTALLCRVNDSFLPIIDVLYDEGIPYRVRSGDGLFFTHYIVTDICKLLEFAADPFDTELFEQLYYKLSCGIGRTDFEYAVRNNIGKDMLSYPEYIASCPIYKENVRKRMKRVCAALTKANNALIRGKCADAIRAVMDGGYGAYLSYRTRDLTKISTLTAIAERQVSLKAFLSRLELLKELVTSGSDEGDGIILSTIHSSKGREFDSVILCDCRNGLLPSVTEPENCKFFSEDELRIREEDRRLFYVAVTRAKNELEIITYRRIMGELSDGFDYVNVFAGKNLYVSEKGMSAVKPVRKIVTKEQLDGYTEGTAVYHKSFGEGVITGRSGGFAEVRFIRYQLPKKIDLTVCIENGLLREI